MRNSTGSSITEVTLFSPPNSDNAFASSERYSQSACTGQPARQSNSSGSPSCRARRNASPRIWRITSQTGNSSPNAVTHRVPSFHQWGGSLSAASKCHLMKGSLDNAHRLMLRTTTVSGPSAKPSASSPTTVVTWPGCWRNAMTAGIVKLRLSPSPFPMARGRGVRAESPESRTAMRTLVVPKSTPTTAIS